MTADQTFTAVGSSVEIALVILISRRRFYKISPVFYFYLLWDLCDNLSLFGISYFHSRFYLPAFLLALAIDSVFVFFVLVELALSVLRPFRTALPRGAIIAVAFAIGIVCAAVWPFARSAAFPNYSTQFRLLIHLRRTISIIEVLFFLILAGCSQLLSINWRDREMQIATGLAFFSFVGITVSILEAGLPYGPLYHHLDQIVSSADILTILYWAFSFAKQSVPRREFTPQMQNFLLGVAGAARSTRISLTGAETNRLRDRDKR